MDIGRPGKGDYAPYYDRYISLVTGNVLDMLKEQAAAFPAYLKGIPLAMSDYRYAPGKWTVKQVAGHIIDTERIMAYRALRIARNDRTALPGFDENDFAANADMAQRTLDNLADEFNIVRSGSLYVFQYLGVEALSRKGTASDHTVSVNALRYIIAGHLQHHLALFEERYCLFD